MKLPYQLKVVLAAGLLFSPWTSAQNSPSEQQMVMALQTFGLSFCEGYPNLSQEECRAILLAIASGDSNSQQAVIDRIRDELEHKLSSPEYLNSVLSKVITNKNPLNLAFASIDSEKGDSVVGLNYSFQHKLNQSSINVDGDWQKQFSIDFSSSGTVTQNKLENPRNFIDTHFSLSGNMTTKLPKMSESFGAELTNFAFQAAQCSGGTVSAVQQSQCDQANEAGKNLLDEALQFLNAYQRYEFGLEFGYESDQSFTVKQQKISAYLFGQYESWSDQTFLGFLGATPSFKLNVGEINPGDETPRSLAGDSSSYHRFSGELALWLPIGNFEGEPVIFTFNFRHYRELSASDLVKAAGLDRYTLRTVSLMGTNGLFVSYSSGRLPLDLQSDDTLALGWKTYF